MKELQVAATKSTPHVHFDPGTGLLLIKGQCYPENAYQFFEPLLSWLDEFLDQAEQHVQMSIQLHLPYMNTSSTKCFMILLEKLDESYRTGRGIQLLWYYDADNESELECAEQFREDLSLPFELIPREEVE
ncbi:DUF1987 domain-containing protein [Paenibacillus koleovorans]|uniref:DUF1987 domain-containing protein n=1 Tax=Paenibacillus koleovorans TaxID=121608 RepID=UPI000FD9AEE4|nr:DUF1987 domain-containing protein [Paenibacillus koleovorans]